MLASYAGDDPASLPSELFDQPRPAITTNPTALAQRVYGSPSNLKHDQRIAACHSRLYESRGGGSIRSAIGSDSARDSSTAAGTARGAHCNRYSRHRQLGCLDSRWFMAKARPTTIPPGAGS